jgi:hypothetical protein
VFTFIWWRKPEYLEKTTDVPQATDKHKITKFSDTSCLVWSEANLK